MSNHRLAAGVAWAEWLSSVLHTNWGEDLLEQEVMRYVMQSRGGGLQMMPPCLKYWEELSKMMDEGDTEEPAEAGEDECCSWGFCMSCIQQAFDV